MQGGEIFVPKIPSMRIVELAKAIAPEARIKKIGMRPGEKLNEILLMSEEARHTKDFDDYFIIEPNFPFWEAAESGGRPVPEGFTYASNSNGRWLSKEELKKMLEELKDCNL
jgi:UDP-N-acetylglucosamine 4,6-dehydratase